MPVSYSIEASLPSLTVENNPRSLVCVLSPTKDSIENLTSLTIYC
jgi:hypothetical protein